MADQLERFGSTVRRLREAKQMSLSELARRAGISKAYLSQLENDERKKPSVDVALQLAQALGMTLSGLLGVEESPHVDPDKLPPGLRVFWREHEDVPEAIIYALAKIPAGRRPLSPTDYWLLYETIQMVRQGSA